MIDNLFTKAIRGLQAFFGFTGKTQDEAREIAHATIANQLQGSTDGFQRLTFHRAFQNTGVATLHAKIHLVHIQALKIRDNIRANGGHTGIDEEPDIFQIFWTAIDERFKPLCIIETVIGRVPDIVDPVIILRIGSHSKAGRCPGTSGLRRAGHKTRTRHPSCHANDTP